MKKITKANKGGFTLLELMLVIAILVILAGLSYISVNDALARHRNTQVREESKFMTQNQSQNDYIRHSLLSGTPHASAAASAPATT